MPRALLSEHVPFSPTSRSLLADNWYSLSYLYFSPIGTIVAISVGLLVSLLTGKERIFCCMIDKSALAVLAFVLSFKIVDVLFCALNVHVRRLEAAAGIKADINQRRHNPLSPSQVFERQSKCCSSKRALDAID